MTIGSIAVSLNDRAQTPAPALRRGETCLALPMNQRGRHKCRPYEEGSRQTYNSAMPLARDRCVCLRKVEYSETSQILTLFGREHGLMSVIAKGAHRTTKQGASK